MRFPRRLLVAVLSVVMLTSGCAAPSNNAVVVFAASSLTDVAGRLTDEYRLSRPEAEFNINLGSSAQLVQQLRSGARADVVITADAESMAELSEGNHVGEQVTLARNTLVLALAAGNPAGISTLDDISAPRVRVALCADAVPCGRAAARVLQDAGIRPVNPSTEDNVRTVLGKVAAGQVDAGFVYRTDAVTARARGVTYLDLPGAGPNSYPAALTPQGSERAEARDFLAWLAGPEAARVFADHGFLRADAPTNGAATPRGRNA